MELADKIPYEKVKFKFISDHYDVHLNGTCIYNNQLHEFKNKDDEDDYENMFVEIYKLSFSEKIKWYFTQLSFELCVGYHWSYSKGKRGKRFYYRKPIWFYEFLFSFYYQIKK